jgi:hypothetical protein
VFAQIVHVEIAVLLEPVLVDFDGERPHQPQAGDEIAPRCWSSDAAAHSYSLDKAMKMSARIRSLDQVTAMLRE